MKIKFYTEETNSVIVLDQQDLFYCELKSGMNPSQQIDYVENNKEADSVRYAILLDDEDNVEKMFVRNLRFPE